MPSRLATVCAALSCCALAVPALAHVPAFGTDNATPATATPIDDPTKSWAIYERVTADGAAYFALEMAAGDRLYATVYAPTAARQPGMVVMAPADAEGARATDAPVPAQVTVPDGYVATAVVSDRAGEAELEPFTPSAYYYTGAFDRQVDATGTYLLAVYEANGEAGPVGVAVGRTETFSATEWLRVPLDVVRIHLWEGQSTVLVLGPGLFALAGGAAWLRRRWPDPTAVGWTRGLAGAAALVVLAAAANTLVQVGRAVVIAGPAPVAVVPLVLVGLQVAVGAWLWRVAIRDARPVGTRTRAGLAAAGLLGLLVWAGYVLGPVLALLAAVVPARE